MDEFDEENSSSDRFSAFRRAVHLESPLEFTVVLIVLVCLLAGVGIWLKTPPNWFLLRHGMWGQLFGRSPRPGNTPEGTGSGQAGGGGTPGPVGQFSPAAEGTIRISKQKPMGSTNSALPNGLELVLLPDRTMTPVAMTLKFSGEVGEIHSSIDSAEVLDSQSGILIASPDTVVLEWRSPPFGPFSPLLMTVFSKDPIKLEKAETVPYRYPYQGGDLR